MPTEEVQATRQFDREKVVYETQMRDLIVKKMRLHQQSVT